jgi:hypothetical protein
MTRELREPSELQQRLFDVAHSGELGDELHCLFRKRLGGAQSCPVGLPNQLLTLVHPRREALDKRR